MVESAKSVDEFVVGPRAHARVRASISRSAKPHPIAVNRPPRSDEFAVAPPALSRQQPRWMILVVVAVVTITALTFVLRASG
jgi:hypothetical protein